MAEIYLDNSATTKVCMAAARKVMELMTMTYGNPSSLHTMGFEAEQELTKARTIVAEKLGVDNKEITFTSGGTEANNLAIFGAVAAKKRWGNKIVTTAIEHPSVLNCMKQLEHDGFEVVYLQPDANGNIVPEQVQRVVDETTILVSIMLVNNEVGSILPVETAAKVIKEKNAPALLHVDAVQAFGKMEVRPRRQGIHLLTVSGHKIYAPKGVGALYIARNVRMQPRMFGGGQEKGMRPGTEAVPLIGGLAEAVLQLSTVYDESKRIQMLYEHCKKQLQALPGVVINSPENGLPYVLNFSTCSVRSETMLHFLAQKGIYVSSGSACTKGKQSHVLTAMGLERTRIQTAIRISFSQETTQQDIDCLVQAVKEGLACIATGKL